MLKYWLWLAELPGLGNQTQLELLEHFGSPSAVYYAEEAELAQVKGLSRAAQKVVLEQRGFDRVNRILEDCQKLGYRILTRQDVEYPTRLRNIYDPPIVLYVRGNLPAFDEEVAIAVVGTRECTPYGTDCANRLGYGIAACGGLVVTGLARGIDSSAAQGALRAGGSVVGVLGNGLDVVYPYENSVLYEDVADAGALISEYPPGTEPEGRHFPVRNRIMSGLSVGSLIVEAPVRSGALITARLALEQGRDVFAVPGPVNAPSSIGCIRLMQEGAYPVVDAWDVMELYEDRFPGKVRRAGPMPEMPFASSRRNRARKEEKPGSPRQKPRPEQASEPEAKDGQKKTRLRVIDAGKLSADALSMLRLMEMGRPTTKDELIDMTEMSPNQVLASVTLLEMEDAVVKTGTDLYVRVGVLKEQGS